MVLLLIEGRFLFARSSWGDCSELLGRLLGAIDGFARSNQWARSEQQAVLLVARGRFSPSERPFLSQ